MKRIWNSPCYGQPIRISRATNRHSGCDGGTSGPSPRQSAAVSTARTQRQGCLSSPETPGSSGLSAGVKPAQLSGAIGDTLSLIPLGGAVSGIRTSGSGLSTYTMKQLTFGPARGVSNVFAAPDATISVESGTLWCFHQHTVKAMNKEI